MKKVNIKGKWNQDKLCDVETPQRTASKKWDFPEAYYTYNKQVQIVNMLFLKDENMEHKLFFEREITKKINSYKKQDINKDRYEADKLVSLDEVIEMLTTSKLKCNYCNDEVLLIYKNVREKKQWTLDRKNNDIGHNRGNVVISCLDCNLKRRCTDMKKFQFTKQLKIVKNL